MVDVLGLRRDDKLQNAIDTMRKEEIALLKPMTDKAIKDANAKVMGNRDAEIAEALKRVRKEVMFKVAPHLVDQLDEGGQKAEEAVRYLAEHEPKAARKIEKDSVKLGEVEMKKKCKMSEGVIKKDLLLKVQDKVLGKKKLIEDEMHIELETIVDKVKTYFLSDPAALDSATKLPKDQLRALAAFKDGRSLILKKKMHQLLQEERAVTGGVYKHKQLKERIVVRSRAQLKVETSRVSKLFLLEQRGVDLQKNIVEWEKNRDSSNAAMTPPAASPSSPRSPPSRMPFRSAPLRDGARHGPWAVGECSSVMPLKADPASPSHPCCYQCSRRTKTSTCRSWWMRTSASTRRRSTMRRPS